jgi:hypothetical protein
MPHQRTLIRDAAKAPVLNKTAAGTNVVTTRIVPWRAKDLPAVAIYTLRESVDKSSKETAPRELMRMPALVIEGALKMADAFVAANGGNMDDALDAMALQLERAIAADDTLAGTVGDVVLADTDVEILRDGDQLIGVIALSYDVTYHTYLPDAEDVELDDFDTADIRHSLANAVHADNQAHDLLDNLYTVP